jgi:hypothetical protein
MFAILIVRENEDGRVNKIILHIVEGGVSILQYSYEKKSMEND